MNAPRLSKKQRQELILTEVQARAAIRISELAQRVGVSGETIRRDLGELGDAGLLNRTYGGAVRPIVTEPGISERGRAFQEERARIGAAAAARVANGEVVMIDGGSTTYRVAHHLAQLRRDLTIITNSSPIAAAAAGNPTFRVMMCPGVYDPREQSVFGEETLDFLSRFSAHVAIFGASSLSTEGPCEAVPGSAAVKRAMLSRAVRSMLVADASKFGCAALERICALDEIGTLATNAAPPADLAGKLAEADVDVVLG